jgi:putative holliday junction resolvase
MPDELYLGFDFGYKRIGVAIGQSLTKSASPVTTLTAKSGVPTWPEVAALIKKWRPLGLIVGLPTKIDGQEQYTTQAARNFAQQLTERFHLPVHMVDERLTTVAAREELYTQGGYRKLQQSQVDSFAACIILEQWLQDL